MPITTSNTWTTSTIWRTGLSVFCVTAFCFYGVTCGQTGDVETGSIAVKLNSLINWDPEMNGNSPNFELTPTKTVNLNDGTGRMLISTLGGTIRVMRPNGSGYELLAAPLLGSAQVGFEQQQESGMTAIALHPNFAGSQTQFGYGKLYTITVEDSANNGGLTNTDVDFPFNNEVHQDVLREWDISAIVGQANLNTLPAITVADSRELLRIDQPGFCHNLVDAAFDTSAQVGDENYGLLFLTLGDGCAGFQDRIRESQDLSTIYGNVLRIDPDPTAHALVRVTSNSTAPNAGQPTYSIPDSNPFNGDDGVEDRNASTLAEIFAYGFRSPYRIGFDSETGDIFIGDVGEGAREEVTQFESGTNAGWGRYEGTRMNADIPLGGPSPHTEPVFEYITSIGRTVVGGVVYRGTEIPELQGKYVFADFGNHFPTGKLFYGSVDPNDPEFGEIFALQLDPEGDLFPIDTNGNSVPDEDSLLPDRIFAIAEDKDGELLLIVGQDPRSFLPSVPGAYVVEVNLGVPTDPKQEPDPIANPVFINVDLSYNFNGIVHGNEPNDPQSNPDHPNGFRSISDRALNFRNGIPSNPVLDLYELVENGAELDIVHLGNRNSVNGGSYDFDSSPDGDDVGIQPNWLADPDQTDRQISPIAPAIEVLRKAEVSVVFQISNGGGSFDVVVGFTDGSEQEFTATGPDWFGPFGGEPNIGSFPGTNSVDRGSPGEELLLTESIFRLSDAGGKMIDSIAFENASNFNGGVAIVAANVVVEECILGDVNLDGQINLLDVGPFVEKLGTQEFQCEVDINLDGLVNLLDVNPFIGLLSGGQP